MSWKNVKEHYRIVHQVQVTEDGICIGSPYVHNIIVINSDGRIVKDDDRTLNDDLSRYQAEMRADPEKLRELVTTPDTFSASVPVFTYKGAEIIEKRCEELGWPNVTHDGDMMYENTFFAKREDALEAAKRNCEAAILLRRMEISDKQERLCQVRARLLQLLSDARKLGVDIGSVPPHAGHVTIAHDGFSGDIIGFYVTREGKRGVAVQQDNTRVVHIYGEKWLVSSPAQQEGPADV